MKSAQWSNNSSGNRNRFTVISLFKPVSAVVFILATLLAFGCSGSEPANPNMGSMLQAQVNLKKEQLANPTDDRLQVMQNMGMDVKDLEKQRIFIHLQELPNESQSEELKSMGVVLYPGSWIPPLENHPTGFLLADMPVDKLAELAELDYITRLETAERAFELQPQA